MAKITGTQYCIFRVGRKYHDVKSIKGFQGHMNRTFSTLNADEGRTQNNKILIGSKDIIGDVNEYIKDIKLRKNGIVGRELLLTASPEFFKGKPKSYIDKWVDCNIRFLKENFGENIRYAVLHCDETTIHLHTLLIPRFEAKRGNSKYRLCDREYFGEKDSFSTWQDIYAGHITEEFKDLHRGMKGSKATHIKMKQYYTLVNATLDEKDMKSVMAKAQNSILLENKVKDLQELLRENLKDQDNTAELKDMVKQLKEDKEIYRQTIKAMSEGYKISQHSIIEMVKRVEEKVKEEKEINKGPERELKKKAGE